MAMPGRARRATATTSTRSTGRRSTSSTRRGWLRSSRRGAVGAEIFFVDGLTERNSPPFGGDLGLMPLGAVPELQWAGCRAHNRWLSEFVAMAPERRFGLALVTPFWGVDE